MNTGIVEGGTFSSTSGLLTAAGAETVIDTTVDIKFSIEGFAYTKAAAADVATPTSDINTGDAFEALDEDESCAFVYMLDASGNVKVAQGPVVRVDPDYDVRAVNPQYPAIPAGYCPFGLQLIQTAGNSSPWIFGTSNWNAAGVTTLTLNLFCLPQRPLNTVTA